jgi:UDP-N-acetylglucosamine--N-acetylmuramyl-(pentapeptide) pyrophosphoryl-undecaprenol N-acetylglucosamine transferase
MSYAYAATTIALSRAGANTAFELIALKKPTLFIPLPLAESRGDQIQNAKYFHSKGVADYREQASLNKSSLVDAILNLFTNKDYYIKNK